MVEFTVTGHFEFPFDMLRYDSCWPKREADAGVIERTTRRGAGGNFEVHMKGLAEPTEARWESFGWKVKDVTNASSGRWDA